MKTTLIFLKDFYSPLHKKWLKTDSTIDIDVDKDAQPIHSFWFTQLKDSPEYFKLALAEVKTTKNKPE